MNFNERARSVLRQVVTLHYSTCEPVGSSLISKTRAVPFSPATIRNIMVRLEANGYLHQPHTSAGRLPTDLGYRAYVNDMRLSLQPLTVTHQTALNQDIQQAFGGPGILRSIAEHIHHKTRLATFYLPFRQSGVRLKHIHFERLDPERLLVLWIGRGGHAYQSVLHLPDSELDRTLLEKIENYFNHAFEGKNLVEIRGQIEPRFSAQTSWDLLLSKSSLLADRLDSAVRECEDLELLGLSTLLEMPEFQDLAKVKIIFGLLEHQSRVHHLIRRVLEERDPWIVFFIGRELEDPELEDLAVVITRMQTRHDELGCVGAIGPKRLPYALAMQLLSHARETVMNRAA